MDTIDPTVLVVDDDGEIRTLVAEFLRGHGVRAVAVGDGRAMRRVIAETTVDLVLLDVMLPGEDGLALCRWLRNETRLPVILLTALASESDRVVGLELGADDYITKPFASRELLARIRAVLRRVPRLPLPVHQTELNEVYRFAGWSLRPGLRELRRPSGALVSLTAGAFDLLVALVRNPGRVLDRDALLELSRGRSALPFDRAIDVQLSRLRRALDDDRLIRTVRGGGYVFAVPVERGEP